jgi:hypothetical protein
LRRSQQSLAKPWGHTMPRRCTVCAHPKVEAIDMALVAGEPYRSVANRYESLSQASVQRHSENHLPATLAQEKDAEMVAHADDLLEQVRDLQVRTFAILEAAEASEQHRTALSAIREARGNLELLAKLLGELDDRPTVNVLISPEWLELRAVIVGALEPYTDARGAVLRAIEGSGNGRA